MKRNFETALAETLKWEGGFVNHPEDPGGMTYKGITAKTYAEFTGRRLATITEKEMRELSDEIVQQIYKRKYWDAVKADQLPDGLDILAFDFAVNSGPTRAIKELQQCLNVSVDGILGPITLKHISTFPIEQILKEYVQARVDFLKQIKTFSTFGKGWMRRVAGIEVLAKDTSEYA